MQSGRQPKTNHGDEKGTGQSNQGQTHHVNTLKQILQETQQQVIKGQTARQSEIKYREHPAMMQRFRLGGTQSTQDHYPAHAGAGRKQLESLQLEAQNPQMSENNYSQQIPLSLPKSTKVNSVPKNVTLPADGNWPQGAGASNRSHADQKVPRATKPSMSIDLSSGQANKIIFIDNTTRMVTQQQHLSGQSSRASEISDGTQGQNSRANGPTQDVKRTPIPSVNSPKLMQAEGLAEHTSQDEDGPRVSLREEFPSAIDSAREHNLEYLDQVISPTHTICKKLSTESLSDDAQNIRERGSAECSPKRVQNYTNEVTSNPSHASHVVKEKDPALQINTSQVEGPEIMINDQGPPQTPTKKSKRTSQENLKETEQKEDGSQLKQIGEYKMLRDLGEGTFGKVKLGMHLRTKKKVAIKILEMRKIAMMSDRGRVKREIKILKEVKHVNIIQLFEIIETSYAIYMIMEYAEGGELFDYIVNKGRLQEKEAAFFYYQLIQGIEFLHSLKIAHRDLKPENLLLDKDCKTIKIVDFGLSNIYKDADENEIMLATACGSPCYAAPEMVEGSKYVGYTVDVWSSGITLYAMICGYLPFEESETALLYQKILKGYYEIPSFLSIDAVRIIKGLLTVDPKERLRFEQIRNQPWIQQGIPAPKLPVPQKANQTCDAAYEQNRQSRKGKDSIDVKERTKVTQKYANESEVVEVAKSKKRIPVVTEAKRHQQAASQLQNAVRRPNTKVQFDIQVNRTTLPPPTKNITTMPPLDQNDRTQRTASNNSCTGGSSGDAAKNAANKSTTTTTAQQNAQNKPSLATVASSQKSVHTSTGLRINALDQIKKPVTQIGTKNHYTAFSPNNSSRVSTKIQLAVDAMRNCAATPQHHINPAGLSQDLKYKVIDASATTTSFNAIHSVNQTGGGKRKSSILIQSGPVNFKLKQGASGNRVNNVRMSPLNKFMKDSVPTIKSKRASAKKQKTMTVNQLKVSDTSNMVTSNFIDRAATSVSPDPQQPAAQQAPQRPRKIRMPVAFSPECIFMAKTSKSVLSRMKLNLAKLCEVEQTREAQDMELIKWHSKYSAEIMDLCRIELVQIEGMQMCEPAAPADGNEEQINKLNMYMVLFSRPEGQESSPDTLELFTSIQEAALSGLPQTANF